MAPVPAVLEKYRDEIDAELRSILDTRRSPLYDMLRYHFGWIDKDGHKMNGSAGKALRPTLCLLACEAVSGKYQLALPVAAALELLHNYSLIHDDIQDNDRERRHRPTVWAVWGKPQAINAGTAMRVLTNSALYRLAKLGVPTEKRFQVQQLLDTASLDLIEGQYLDISYEECFNITVRDYLLMVERKTAALIACALETGALLGTDDKALVESFRKFGWNIGLAFQIRDDILGIWGDKQLVGKPQASDIRRKKKNLPVVYALEKSRDRYKEKLVQYYTNGSRNAWSVKDVLDVLEELGAQSYAQKMNRDYCHKARRIIEGIAMKLSDKKEFEELINFLEDRSF